MTTKITSGQIVELGVAKFVDSDDGKPTLSREQFDSYSADAKVDAMKAVRDGRIRFIDD
jgi:hypothetical protein